MFSCASEHQKRDLERLEIQYFFSWSKSVLLSLVVLRKRALKRLEINMILVGAKVFYQA